ncbi:MAG: hypothetical protein HUU16_05985 [Candidatus Omnitrophica bacterium]|nr:hypothetical protein [Candidatus Omnitrophota bacterium]
MRIADHAPVLQGSPTLQQPSNAAHLQQTLAPEVARAAAHAELRRQETQVNDPGKTEGRSIHDRIGGDGRKKAAARKAPSAKTAKEGPKDSSPPSQPGSGDILDIVV